MVHPLKLVAVHMENFFVPAQTGKLEMQLPSKFSDSDADYGWDSSREKYYYGRSSRHWNTRTYIIAMCQHADAWGKEARKNQFKELHMKVNIFKICILQVFGMEFFISSVIKTI